LCWTDSTFVCTNITLGTYTDAACEGVKYFCKANGSTACQTKVCADYLKIEGITAGTALATDA
jgi:hypothetical protein